jgi:hypothetical protein
MGADSDPVGARRTFSFPFSIHQKNTRNPYLLSGFPKIPFFVDSELRNYCLITRFIAENIRPGS